MTSRRRTLAFAAVVAAAAAVGIAFAARAALRSDPGDRTLPRAADVRRATADASFVVYQHVARDAHYAEIAIAPATAPRSRRTFTGLVCERVHFAADRGLCLMPKHGVLGQSVEARIFDGDFRPIRELTIDGLASRARISAGGRYGATTTFVSGHSYLDEGFSTLTSLIDVRRGAVVTDLEKFRVTRNGKPFKEIDFNFWGVTFARDERRFYASLSTGGKIYLVEGDVRTRSAKVIASGVECPALSPDETRVAFKLRLGDRWRLHVLDLETGRRTPLAESRSIDDQVEWLDDERILYGYISDIWVVRADGSGKPEVYLPNALSPAVVRS